MKSRLKTLESFKNNIISVPLISMQQWILFVRHMKRETWKETHGERHMERDTWVEKHTERHMKRGKWRETHGERHINRTYRTKFEERRQDQLEYQFLPPSAASVELKFLSWIDPQGWNILARKPHKYAFILFPIGNPYNPLPEPPYSLFLGLCWINLIKMIKYSNDNRTSLRQLDSTHLDFGNMILISWFLFW